MGCVSLLDKMDPEVAKAAIEQFPNFANVAVETLRDFKEIINQAFADDSISAGRCYDIFDGLMHTLETQASQEDIPFEERKYYLEKMKEVAQMAASKDSEGKKLKYAAVLTLAGIGILVIGGVAAYFGINIDSFRKG